VGINTAEAYRNCRHEMPSSSLLLLAENDITKWRDIILNDFEEFAFKKHPVIGKIKDELYGCGALFSSMSGSGSSVYGIFNVKPLNMPDTLKDMVIWEGTM
jgi:4-diphosphocytidyl-2-C-methyl-D-erythritol kinase